MAAWLEFSGTGAIKDVDLTSCFRSFLCEVINRDNVLRCVCFLGDAVFRGEDGGKSALLILTSGKY